MDRVNYVDLATKHAALRDQLMDALGRVLDHGWFIGGPEVGQLETALAARLGLPHVITCNSGTDALLMALRLRGVGPGDEVIIPSHSFIATGNAVLLLGATPVFADIDDDTMVLDPARVAAAITARTRAVVAVHLNGYPSDLSEIHRVCDSRSIAVIEDCAQAFGATRAGRGVGQSGLGCFSFHPLKVLSAYGDGG
ncbi:MAG: DegT/DnrJ/EryC1/StrS family aminotransferase, partial [Myxococcota bacterium]